MSETPVDRTVRLALDLGRAKTHIQILEAELGDLDYCLDKWRHGAPDQLARLAAQRMAALDGIHEPVFTERPILKRPEAAA